MATREEMIAALYAGVDEIHKDESPEYRANVKTSILMVTSKDEDLRVIYELLLKKRFGDALREAARRIVLE